MRYPDPLEMPAENAPIVHCRARVVIPAFDIDQAKGIAEKVAEICACNVEAIVGITAMDDGRLLGETVFMREFYPVRVDGQIAMAIDEALTSELDDAS